MDISISPLPIIKFNVPEWYKDRDFLTFLNSGKVATWHRQYARANEYSDVFMTFCDQEGSNSYYPSDDPEEFGNSNDTDVLPERYWRVICEYCKTNGIKEALIWLTNLE